MTASYERRWETRRRGGRSVADESRTSYYDIPVIHKPHWKWAIIVYFFVGGIAGASSAVAAIADLFGGKTARPIVRAGRYLGFLTMLLSPPLLIYDLGRPERFHHMMRVLKIRSPMSVGTWVLFTYGAASTVLAFIQAAEDGLLGRRNALARLLRALPSRLLSVSGLPPAFFLSGYTGVLLASTAVPLWAKNYLLLAPLFVVSAMSNAVAALSLILACTRGTSREALQRLARLGAVSTLAELGLLLAIERNSGKVIARPMTTGRLGNHLRFGVTGAGIVAPLSLRALSRLTGTHSRVVTVVESVLTIAGGFLLRYVIVTAGRHSADDPQATFEFTRADGQRPS